MAQHIVRVASGDRSIVAIPSLPLHVTYAPKGKNLTEVLRPPRHPGVGKRLVDAFGRADEMFNAAQRLYPYASPWLIEDVEQSEQEMGPRIYAPGMEAKREDRARACSAHRRRSRPLARTC